MTRRDVLLNACGERNTAAVSRVEAILAETRRRAPRSVEEPQTSSPNYDALRAVLLCHHCAAELDHTGRSVASVYPCCGDERCERARKRKYEAERRVRQRLEKEQP